MQFGGRVLTRALYDVARPWAKAGDISKIIAVTLDTINRTTDHLRPCSLGKMQADLTAAGLSVILVFTKGPQEAEGQGGRVPREGAR